MREFWQEFDYNLEYCVVTRAPLHHSLPPPATTAIRHCLPSISEGSPLFERRGEGTTHDTELSETERGRYMGETREMGGLTFVINEILGV